MSEGDKIRNYILMGLPAKLQNEYYDKYWNRIEKCTNYDVSAFIRDYLSMKQRVIPAQNKVYAHFKAYVEETALDAGNLLADMFAYAKRYQVLLGGATKNAALDACIRRLNRLETTITRPFFLEVLRLFDEQTLTMAQVTDIFFITENYLFRRTICDLPTNALNKIFLMLHREIVKYDGTEDNYVEKFKFALLSKRDKARFPDDDEFGTAFTERQIYHMKSKNKLYIFERLENFGTAEDKDVYRHCDDGAYTIEHIMPQHLTPAWIAELGEDYEQIHETWLHRIANLTLTAYNSKYSNNSFADKKHMKNGLLDSGIRMNTLIAQKDRWTLAELEERSEYLFGRALDIWAAPYTEYRPAEKQAESYSLDDDVPLSGRVIVRFGYKNAEQPVESWIEMFERVLKILHAEDKSVLTRLAYETDTSVELAQNVSNCADGLRGAVQIDGDIYVERNTSTDMKISMLKKFFKLYGADPADLVFYLREDAENHNDEIGTRYEVRRKYWTYALGFIKEAHGQGGAFANVRPSKDNWVSGFFGVGGCSISCVANFGSARVELYLLRATKEENKTLFDMLFSHKDEIESTLGVPLVWSRGDNIKSSKIYYQLGGVSVENETDWLQMARFHAEWSKKFYDVLVPYLL